MAPFFIPEKIMIVRHGGAVVSRSREAWNHADLEFFVCVLWRERGRGGPVHDRGAGLAGCKSLAAFVDLVARNSISP